MSATKLSLLLLVAFTTVGVASAACCLIGKPLFDLGVYHPAPIWCADESFLLEYGFEVRAVDTPFCLDLLEGELQPGTCRTIPDCNRVCCCSLSSRTGIATTTYACQADGFQRRAMVGNCNTVCNEPAYTVTGTVVYSDNTPADLTEVAITRAPYVTTATTDDSGVFSIPGLLAGSYTIRATRGTCQTPTATLTITQDVDIVPLILGCLPCTDCSMCPQDPSCQLVGTWTEWFDTDNPSGNGDYEPLDNKDIDAGTCDVPIAVECRLVQSKQDWTTAGQVATCDTTTGFYCTNKDNGGGWLNTVCLDYEARFLCP